jgi:hypothetical protein
VKALPRFLTTQGDKIMAIRHVNLAIRRDELTLLKTTVAQWEVPLLYLVHGEEMVQVLPGEPWADVDPPEVLDEYRRLEAKYKMPAGEDGSPGQRAVGAVYGSFGASPQLRQAIEAATFERATDLLGLKSLQAASTAADEAAAKARARLQAATEASENADADADEGDEGEETPAQKAAREKREKAAAAKAAKAASAAGSTPGRSLL